MALVVTREGMPLGYELFAGNRPDVTTVEEIVETMEARYGLAQRIWVMDRGMTSEDNLTWLREGGRRYLVGTPKSELRKWARQIADAIEKRRRERIITGHGKMIVFLVRHFPGLLAALARRRRARREPK